MYKKRIAFFLPLMTSGGAERVSINILNQLDREKYEIHLLLGTMEGDAAHLIPEDIEVHDLNSPRTILSILKLRKKIKEIKPYALFSSLNRAHIALNLSLLAIFKKPKVIMRIPSSPKLVFKYNEMGKLFKILLDFALKNADSVIAQTPEMKKEIEHYHNVNPEKITVLINPIDRKSIDQNIKEPFNKFNQEHINVVASGRLSVEKGYDVLLKAFFLVHKQNPLFRLYVIGADYNNELLKYQKIMDEYNLHSIVSFLGFQKNPYMFYQNSDLFVLSSRREGLPNTVLENLYLKKPVVGTTCIPFMSELIQNGKNGFLVDIEDVQQLANSILNFQNLKGSKGFVNEKEFLTKDIFELLETSEK